MDKKQLTIVSILGILIVALVAFVLFSSESEVRLTKNQVLRIDDTIYELPELEKYLLIYNESTGDIAKASTEEEKEAIFESFIQTKIYASVADKKAILFPAEELTTAKNEYASKSETFAQYGVTEEDYIRYAEDEYKMTNLSNNFGTYYELPADVYKEFEEYYSGDELKTYTYRMMNFRYEVPESGESGDAIEAERQQETVLAKAQTALAAVKSGDDFETVAKEHSDGTYSFTQNSLVFLNGEVQYAIEPVLESKLGYTELYDAVKALNAGEYTDIIEIADATSYYFVKVENIEDGFVGEAAEEVKEQLLYEYQETLLIEELDYEANTASLVRFLYK